MKDYEALSRKHFDKQAPVYDQKNTLYYSKNGKISCEDIARRLEAVSYHSLLDVGCGTGYLISLLIPDHPADYLGLDLSQEMLKVAGQKHLPSTRFVQGSACQLPFESERFDVVTCSQSFHHYPFPDQALREALRVLKKGGIYLLSDTGIGGVGAWLDNHLFFKLSRTGDCHTTGRKGMEALMKKAGFTQVEGFQLQGLIYTVVGKKEG